VALYDYAHLCRKSYVGGSEFVDVDDLRFGIFVRDGKWNVVFRGSANRQNWLRDFDIVAARSPHGYLTHRGILEAFTHLWPHILDKIPSNPSYVRAVGHSLGGGIAAQMAHHFGCVAVTFGAPRLWWSGNQPPRISHVRVACDDDPVAMIPRWLFKHDCQERIMLEDKDCEFVNVDDHDIDVYISRLKWCTE